MTKHTPVSKAEAAAIDAAAKPPMSWPVHGVTRDEFLRMLWSNVEHAFDIAVSDFRSNASTGNWERMTAAMYVYQSVQGMRQRLRANLAPDEDALLRTVAAAPIGRWSELVYTYVQQQIEDL